MPTLFVVLLSPTASGKSQSVDGKVGALFRQARRSGLWPDAQFYNSQRLHSTLGYQSPKTFEVQAAKTEQGETATKP